ncbi:MAG TPA: hypothetical protein VGR66_10065 [Candidatus Eisenbacteria bacterium]|jgi:hypothetical protein|nr:hypothetical protein [Candidatus Eisenbacteria bacterium]
MTVAKPQRTGARLWFPVTLFIVLAGIGFFVGWQKHVLWLALVLAALGAGLAWLMWLMFRVAIFTLAGALLAGVVLALLRSHGWFLGALGGACLGFWAGWHWHRPALFQRKAAP